MVDGAATRLLIDDARRMGHRVRTYDVDSSHLLELDAPDVATGIVRQIIGDVAG